MSSAGVLPTMNDTHAVDEELSLQLDDNDDDKNDKHDDDDVDFRAGLPYIAKKPVAHPSLLAPFSDDYPFSDEVIKSLLTSSRKPRVVHDEDGTAKTYTSALGLLTRNLVDLLHASQTNILDLNDTAQRLQVPKRRLYDITNVLQGIGMIEKRSKSTISWKGSEKLLGSSMDAAARESIAQTRKEIAALHQEEVTLDKWIAKFQKTPTNSRAINASDIIDALVYPVDQDGNGMSCSKDLLFDEAGNVRRAFLAIHAPYDTVAVVPKPDEGTSNRRLYVGTSSGLGKHKLLEHHGSSGDVDGDGAPNVKTKFAFRSRARYQNPKGGDTVLAYTLPVEFNDSNQKLESIGAFQITALFDERSTSTKNRSESGEDGKHMGRNESLADFFANGEEME